MSDDRGSSFHTSDGFGKRLSPRVSFSLQRKGRGGRKSARRKIERGFSARPRPVLCEDILLIPRQGNERGHTHATALVCVCPFSFFFQILYVDFWVRASVWLKQGASLQSHPSNRIEWYVPLRRRRLCSRYREQAAAILKRANRW